uniref:NADH dehydrogenase [ubiquinone] 1 beta subcomplex subunit 8, mitochondrial n=1 Tax=Macaca nemestrina TaxID=9545 RepID=A0A2K6CN98_MACNE
MAVARAGVLGVQWLQRESRNVVLLGAQPASRITKDMFPGLYPRTPEELKYIMRVEDYQRYPDEGMGYGDYPKLPDRSQHEKDPWYSWDQPDLRLNWGEPIPFRWHCFYATPCGSESYQGIELALPPGLLVWTLKLHSHRIYTIL